MTRVLDLEKYDFREKSSACSSDSDEDESINGIFTTSEGVVTTNNETKKKSKEDDPNPRGGLFGMKRLGLSRKDREKDADAAAGSVTSNSESKLRGSVETNSDETYLTLGTTVTGDHVNALLKKSQAHNEDNKVDDDADNEGVEDYWGATEPGTIIRDTKVLTNIPQDEDEEIPITDRIADRGKAERRNTSGSMLTAPFDNGDNDFSDRLDDDVENDLLKYAEAMIQRDEMPGSPSSGGAEKRPLFKSGASFCTDVVSTAETAMIKNTGKNLSDEDIDEEDEDQDEEHGLKYTRKSSIEQLKHFFSGGHTPSHPSDTYDLRDSSAIPKKKKKSKNIWKRRTSDGTTDSMWSWSQAGANFGTKTSDGYNRRASNASHRSNTSGNYSNDDDYDDDNKSHNSMGTFDKSWLGLGNTGNGRGGPSWRDVRRQTLTPFVDFDGDSFHSQRSTSYRMGERTLKRCIGIMFVVAIVVLSGALIGINIISKDDSVGEPLTKGTPSSSLTEEEKLSVAESVNEACSPLSIESSDGRHKCQHICRDHLCCFDGDEDGFSCQDDSNKSCSVYAGCVILVEDLLKESSGQTAVEHIDPVTLAARINDACSNIKSSMGKLECRQACEDHMCCFESDPSMNCHQDKKMECSTYKACAVLSGDTNENVDNGTVNTAGKPLPSWDTAEADASLNENKPAATAPPLPSWDTAEPQPAEDAVEKIDYTSDTSNPEGQVVTIGDSSEINGPSTNQVSIPSPDNGGSDSSYQFSPLASSATSSEGVMQADVDLVCQNTSNPSDKNKCAKLCAEYMCCFESHEEKACFTNSDCSIYGSCVLLGSDPSFDPNFVTDDYEPTTTDDQYSYDDDMFVVDTENEEEDTYDTTVFHIGNRTLI